MDCLAQVEGVERVAEALEFAFAACGEGGSQTQALEGCLGRIVALDDVSSVAILVEEFEGGEGEVDQERELVGVEVIHERKDPGILEAEIAEVLADVGPVLLFDVGVVILLIGTTAGVVDRALAFGEVVVQMVIEELGAGVAIEATDVATGRAFSMPWRARWTATCPFPQMAAKALHPVAISTRLTV